MTVPFAVGASQEGVGVKQPSGLLFPVIQRLDVVQRVIATSLAPASFALQLAQDTELTEKPQRSFHLLPFPSYYLTLPHVRYSHLSFQFHA